MYYINNGKLVPLLFFFSCTLVLSSCAQGKKSVDPYRDTTYTSSVANVRSGDSSTTAVSDESRQNTTMTQSSEQSKKLPSMEILSDTMLPLLTLVDDRIVAYEGKFEQWQKFAADAATLNLDEEQLRNISACQNQLTDILAGYNTLHQQLLVESNGRTDGSFIEGFLVNERLDMSFLESDCQQIVIADRQVAGGWVAGTREMLLEEKVQELNEKMVSKEYQQVVELYAQLPLEKGQSVPYDVTYSYAQALLRTGREDVASQVFQDLLVRLQDQSQIEREFKLMQLIADIQFGMENYDAAFERYIDIINRYAGLGENIDWARKQQSVISARNSQGIEVKNFSELMRGYLSYNPERDAFRVYLLASQFLVDFPESIVLPTVNHILFESRNSAESWFDLLLRRISVLKVEKKYQEALQVIDQLPMQEIPMEKRELLNSLHDELISVSFEEEESKRMAVEETLQNTWNKGQELLRSREYDQAIEVFSTLLETTYSERANDKIVEASQLAAQEDRRKAAELFVQASKTVDQESRIALLLQSRQLLKGILQKYPQSGLTEKAGKNLERIEQEILSIDPALLVEPDVPADKEDILQQPGVMSVNGIHPVGLKEQVPTGFSQE